MFLPSILFVFVSLFSCFVSAADIQGNATLESQRFEELSVQGEANLTSVTVTGDTSIQGMLSAGSCTFEALDVQGDVKVAGVTVLGEAVVHGDLGVRDQSIFHKKLTAHGNVDIQDSEVKGTLTVHGKIEVKSSKLTAMRISTREMVLKNSSTGNITMEKTSSGWSIFGWFIGKQEVEQTIKLYDTVVKGDIDFVTGKGKVYVHGNSRVTGKVKGGVICS